jgi:hypothetical protein
MIASDICRLLLHCALVLFRCHGVTAVAHGSGIAAGLCARRASFCQGGASRGAALADALGKAAPCLNDCGPLGMASC